MKGYVLVEGERDCRFRIAVIGYCEDERGRPNPNLEIERCVAWCQGSEHAMIIAKALAAGEFLNIRHVPYISVK